MKGGKTVCASNEGLTTFCRHYCSQFYVDYGEKVDMKENRNKIKTHTAHSLSYFRTHSHLNFTHFLIFFLLNFPNCLESSKIKKNFRMLCTKISQSMCECKNAKATKILNL